MDCPTVSFSVCNMKTRKEGLGISSSNVLSWGILIIALTSASGFAEGYITCTEPSPDAIGHFMRDSSGSNSRDSVVLVKELCSRIRTRNTTSWIRGTKVKDNCSNIPPLTAIATFSGKNGTYNRVGLQHAAIFMSCNKQAILVYDQSPHSRGIRQRRLRYGGPASASNGNLFFTIV